MLTLLSFPVSVIALQLYSDCLASDLQIDDFTCLAGDAKMHVVLIGGLGDGLLLAPWVD